MKHMYYRLHKFQGMWIIMAGDCQACGWWNSDNARGL